MKLRARLILAFFLLAVVPMSAIVTYSYYSSIFAFRRAVQAEALATAGQLSNGLARVRSSLDELLGRMSAERFPNLVTAEGTLVSDPGLLEQLQTEMETVAPVVEAVEFIPVAVAAPDAGGSLAVAQPLECPEPAAQPSEAPAPKPPEPTRLGMAVYADEPGGGGDAGDGEQRFVYVFRTASSSREVVSITIDADLAPITAGVAEATRFIAGVAAGDEGVIKQEELVRLGQEAVRQIREHRMRELEEARAAHGQHREEREGEAAALKAEREEKRGKGARPLQPRKQRWDAAHQEELKQRQKQLAAMLGHDFRYPIRSGNRVVGHLSAQVRVQALVSSVLRNVRRDEGDIPFAIDCEGGLHTAEPQDLETLAAIPHLLDPSEAEQRDESWIVVKACDEPSGMTFGIARPVGAGLHEIRRTAVRNLLYGLLLVGLAGLCVLPMSNRLTEHLRKLGGAADALAAGDLRVRVPVHSNDEVGQLADAFNHMAAELEKHQEQLLEHERQRQAQELQHRLLEVENQRKSRELEDARQLQLSLLPSRLPDSPLADIAVTMRTATEVGGDYYDIAECDDGSLSVTIGDATGHGAAAGTMVTIAKCLFTASGTARPQHFLQAAGVAIRRMRPGRMCMAMQLLRLQQGRITLSSAGMPPLLVHRRSTGDVEEVLLPGVPLGAIRTATYGEQEVAVEPGDTLLLMSDGFPELRDSDGEPLGYERARLCFAELAERPPREIIAGLEAAAQRWREPRPQDDDITFIVLRVR